MSTFFLYILPSLLLLGAIGFGLKIFMQKQCHALKEQIDVYYMRERYMNDLLNIDQLTLNEMNTLHKSGNKIIHISERHDLKNRALFSQLNINKAQGIIEKAIHKKNWLQTAEKYIAQPKRNLTAPQHLTRLGSLLEEMPFSLVSSKTHKLLNKKNAEILTTALIPAVKETVITSPSTTQQITSHEKVWEEMQDVNYMKKALRSTKPVAIIKTRSERSATGFLVAPQLFLTAYAVLPNQAEARKATITLNYQNDENGDLETIKILNLNPEKLFMSDEKLNYTLVGIDNEENKAKVVAADITLQPVLDTDSITLIHHPENKPQHISFFNTKLTRFAGDFINYTADTAAGSIGAAIFNSNWQVVAMHQSTLVSEDGSASDQHLKEGVKISSILKDIEKKFISLSRTQQEYLQKHLLNKKA